MSTAPVSSRRAVHYASLEDFRADAERLANVKYRTLGQWTYPQILDHLSRTIVASIDGFGFQAPWFARKLIAPFMRNAFLTRPMRAGFRLPARAVSILPGADLSLPAAIEKLQAALARFEAEPQRAEHPFLGKLASQESTALQLRHAELHMSFVVPEESDKAQRTQP
jgi:hypothetical protein